MKWLERLMERSPSHAPREGRAPATQYVSPRVPSEREVFEQDVLASENPTTSAAVTTPRASAERGVARADETASRRAGLEPATARTARADDFAPGEASARLPSRVAPAPAFAARAAPSPEPSTRGAATPLPDSAELAPARPSRTAVAPPSVRTRREATAATSLEPPPARAESAPPRALSAHDGAAEAVRAKDLETIAPRPSPAETPGQKATTAGARAVETRSVGELRPASAPVIERPTTGPRLSIGRLVLEVTTSAPVSAKRASPRRRVAPASKLAAPRPSPLRFGLGVK